MDQDDSGPSPTRTEVLGMPVDAVTMRSAVDRVRTMLKGDRTHVIAAVNPEKVIAAQQDPALFTALNRAALLIPDGIGIVLAARLLRNVHMERVPGADLMPEICRLAADEGYRVFLYGAKQEIVSEAAQILGERFPKLKIVGVQHGYVPEEDLQPLVKVINASGADVLFVGLGSPKQELWMDRYKDSLNVKVCQGVGGTFDAICGNPRRAPVIFQKLYLEWVYRLLSQPSRLGRQIITLPRFVLQVLKAISLRS